MNTLTPPSHPGTLGVLLSIWRDLLGKPVDASSHFFHEGGDSLMAVRMFVEIETRLKVQLPLSRLIQAPTAGALAAVIDASLGEPPRAADTWQTAFPTQEKIPHTPIPIQAVDMGIDRWFESIVQRYPNRAAFHYDGLQVSFQRLNQEANRVAHALLEKSPDLSKPVGLVASYSYHYLAGLMGAFKAGLGVVFLDPGSPEGRNRLILEQCGGAWVLTTSATFQQASALVDDKYRIILLDGLGAYPAENPGLQHSPDRLAYIISTSGSTGTPKGVIHTHCTSMHATLRGVNSLELSASDAWLSTNSLTHVAAINQVLRMWVVGGAFYPYNVRQSGLAGLDRFARQHGITVLSLVPSVFRHLVGAVQGRVFEGIRIVMISGETLYASDVDLFKKHFAPGTKMINNLGCSEYTAYCQFVIDHQTTIQGRQAPVGFPTQDTKIFLVDEHHQPVPDGETGQIAIQSRYLSPGYWGEPELTAARFENVPGADGERIYYPGDVGRMGPDGLVFLGRGDFQVKVRGSRVELGEVEAVLHRHPSVQEAAVITKTGEEGNVRLAAFLVPRPGAPLDSTSMNIFTREHLPPYMVPSEFVFISQLPATRTGKVDRGALAAYQPGEVPLPSQAPPMHPPPGPSAGVRVTLVPVQPAGRQAPLFGATPLGGSALAFWELAAALGADQPFYAIEIPPRPEENEAPGFVERTASAYASALRGLQANGPYRLLGYSFGGVIAYEAAVQLQASGQTVAFLGLIDTFGPGGYTLPIRGGIDKAALYAGLLAGHLTDLAQFKGKDRQAYWGQLVAYYQMLWQSKRSSQGKLAENRLRDPAALVAQHLTGRIWADTGYIPQPYPGQIHLFRAAVDPLRDPDLGWGKLALGGIVRCMLPGNHVFIMRKPVIRLLAKALAQALAETRD